MIVCGVAVESLLVVCGVVVGTTGWRLGNNCLEGQRQHLLPPLCSKIDSNLTRLIPT